MRTAMPRSATAACVLGVALAALTVGCAQPAPNPGGPCDGPGCGGGCVDHADCPGGRCRPEDHVCVGCLVDGDCAPGMVCGPMQRCVPGCSMQQGCGDAGVCSVDAGACVECLADADCRDPARPRCEPGRDRCVPCYPTPPEKDNCPANQYCFPMGASYTCLPGCKLDAECTVAHGTPKCSMHTCSIASCAAGFTDCNGGYGDGCEIETDADARNCGACGRACGSANTSAVACMAGACVLQCKPGFFDCDGDAANGCESNTQVDAANCGACGAVCVLAHANPQCVAGACAVATCGAGFADCDGKAQTGCETPTSSDILNCGKCANVCFVAHGTPACMAGACSIASCAAGWADCAGGYGDGCETSTDTAPAHCGGCGNACQPPNAVPRCAAAMCGFSSCLVGFGDCDGKPVNGCEINTAVDPANCGNCGVVCSSANIAQPTCAGGFCTGMCNPGFADCDNDRKGTGCERAITTLSDCGGCNVACSSKNVMNLACTQGKCTGACVPGFGDCNKNFPLDGCEVPLDTNSDCGACGNACAVNASCQNGQCVVVCGPKINELVTGTNVSGDDEWVEIYNSCNIQLDLTGYRLLYRSANNNNNGADINLYAFVQVIPPGGFLLLAGMKYSGAGDGGVMVDGALTNSMAAAGGAVGVRDPNGNLVDSVAWDTLNVPNNFTETQPAPNAPTVAAPGNSIARTPSGSDSNNNKLDFQLRMAPTPRSKNL